MKGNSAYDGRDAEHQSNLGMQGNTSMNTHVIGKGVFGKRVWVYSTEACDERRFNFAMVLLD